MRNMIIIGTACAVAIRGLEWVGSTIYRGVKARKNEPTTTVRPEEKPRSGGEVVDE